MSQIQRKPTRSVPVGNLTIGANAPIVIQSMCATKTWDVEATARQAEQLREHGAGIVRVAVDNLKDAEALADLRKRTRANLSVDLQENYRMAEKVAPFVDKIRYNPGHLHHHEKEKSAREKVAWLIGIARKHNLAVRVGVNCGSVDPEIEKKFGKDHVGAVVASALEHCAYLEDLGFARYCVSIKDSDPAKVIEANRRFSAARPDVPIHLGVTEAGLPPEGVLKTRLAFEPLLRDGIGDTLRVSLTVPNDRKHEEISAGKQILADVAAGRFLSGDASKLPRLNIVSCPSCARVENDTFVHLAEKVRDLAAYAKDVPLTIAVMGCRVNGPGEADDADLGLWCGPTTVNLKRKSKLLGSFSYEKILPNLKEELDRLIEEYQRQRI